VPTWAGSRVIAVIRDACNESGSKTINTLEKDDVDDDYINLPFT